MVSQSVIETARRYIQQIPSDLDLKKAFLFGSYATGKAGPDSDVDLLVVMLFTGPKRSKRLEVRMAVHDIVASKDIIVVTPEEFACRKNIVGTIEYPASREGKVLYAQA